MKCRKYACGVAWISQRHGYCGNNDGEGRQQRKPARRKTSFVHFLISSESQHTTPIPE